MKIGTVSFLQYSPVVNNKINKNTVSFCSDKPDEIIKPMPDGTKMVLRGSDFSNPKYIGFMDENGNLIRDMRFDKRYNEIRAIEYQKPLGGFNYIQNSLSVTFDNDKKIRNVYMISNDGGYNIHNVLNIKHGHTVSIFDEKKGRISVGNEDKKELLNYIISYTKNVLQEAQDNNLIGSEGVLDKFSDFTKNLL